MSMPKSQSASLTPRHEDGPDLLHHCVNKFREINQRWNNRLTGHRDRLVKPYKDGRLAFVCDLNVLVPVKWVNEKLPAVGDNPRRGFKCHPSVILKADVPQPRDFKDWEQKPMLVQDVELVQGPEGFSIPSLIRLYGAYNEVTDCRGGFLYQSAVDSAFKFISGFSDWESGVLVADPESREYDFAYHDVEGTSQIVEHITDDEREFIGSREFFLLVAEAISSALRVLVHNEGVEASAAEGDHGLVQVGDVLFGPFGL